MSKAIYWFRNDLRLSDNPGWARSVSNHDEVLGIYVLPQRWLREGAFPNQGIGSHRMRFLLTSLRELREDLRAAGSDLRVISGDPCVQVCRLLKEEAADELAVAEHPGSDERKDIEAVRSTTSIAIHISENFTLFNRNELPFELGSLPTSFSAFRRKVEQQSPAKPVSAAKPLGKALTGDVKPCELDERWSALEEPPLDSHTLSFTGGRRAGLKQLNDFLFTSKRIESYKETRNGLDGWGFSSKLSPWLALGCLSAREVAAAIDQYEADIIANESTYWLYFELLWREYFQWLSYRYDKKMFALKGIRDQDPELSFNSKDFNNWCLGNTTDVFINAFMRQLRVTGWMSNRGRQIVASYLVNELNIEWRYGAAWFEEQLLDYDVASNWGNWQYLAGVGTDPRGRRRFNTGKQQAIYDPEGYFVARWGQA